jgi:signal transduction histidine kinase
VNNLHNQSATILIVDDNPVNLDTLYLHLTKAGYVVLVAEDGLEGVARAQHSQPDLILLDVIMPDIDGFEANRRLKEQPETRNIPVIFLTALTDAAIIEQAFAIGGVDYIAKPFRHYELLTRVKAHLQTRQLQKQLQQRNNDLSAFAHTVAHDLKNPLQTVIGFAEMIQEYEDLSDKSQQYINIVIETGLQMYQIINSLLLLAEIDRIEVIVEPLDMKQVAQDCLERVAHLVTAVEGVVEQPDQWPCALGYAPWVEEVWANYLTNGIKYGGRPLQLQLGANPQPDGMIRFWIRDNGPGIPPEHQPQLFSEFTRLANNAHQTGSGLGLSIVKRIITKLGGQVGVESDVGQGSLFYFTLPIVVDE